MVPIVRATGPAIGWVPSGSRTVLEALSETVGQSRTPVMPTPSWQQCDLVNFAAGQFPVSTHKPPVPGSLRLHPSAAPGTLDDLPHN